MNCQVLINGHLVEIAELISITSAGALVNYMGEEHTVPVQSILCAWNGTDIARLENIRDAAAYLYHNRVELGDRSHACMGFWINLRIALGLPE